MHSPTHKAKMARKAQRRSDDYSRLNNLHRVADLVNPRDWNGKPLYRYMPHQGKREIARRKAKNS